jgi:L,D-peptidoglycan transpeptidase YkuD (ErfK/YbiS/YcfS/YnhG family)
MEIIVKPNKLQIGEHTFRCALGPAGLIKNKREGDGATPVGRFPFRQMFYRADRIEAPPACGLPVRAIQSADGWCDDPEDPMYNRLITLPYSAHHEVLWRNDHLYDLMVTIGYNDDPVKPGAGSAIFMHVAKTDYSATSGCIALAFKDLQFLVEHLSSDSVLVITDE